MKIENQIAKEENEKYDKIYGIHKYWSRKPWRPISNFIKTYSKDGDKIVDLFLGSGVTALESISLNRDFVGFDLNPAAIFISENTINSNFNELEFFDELNHILKNIKDKMMEVYAADEICKVCEKPLIMDHINVGPKYNGKERGQFFCFSCGKNKVRLERPLTKKEVEMYKKSYKISKWIPITDFPKEFYKDRFSYKGVKRITDMFSSRNLYILSELLDIIKNSKLKYESLFLLIFSNTLLHVSKLKSENVRPLSVNNYWIPDDYMEENVVTRFIERTRKAVVSKQNLLLKLANSKNKGGYKLFNQSSFHTGLPSQSVDYIITDPPYGEAIQYSELSTIWNSWLGFNFDIKEEIIINPKQKKGVNEYLNLLEKSIKEGSRILKNNSYFTLCFHNKEFKIMKDVLEIFRNNNLVLTDVSIVDLLGNSFNNNWAKFSPKSDLYITFKKESFSGFTHNKEYSLQSMIKDIINKQPELDYTAVYDNLLCNLLKEAFFNEYTLDLSSLTIKELNKMIKSIENGD